MLNVVVRHGDGDPALLSQGAHVRSARGGRGAPPRRLALTELQRARHDPGRAGTEADFPGLEYQQRVRPLLRRSAVGAGLLLGFEREQELAQQGSELLLLGAAQACDESALVLEMLGDHPVDQALAGRRQLDDTPRPSAGSGTRRTRPCCSRRLSRLLIASEVRISARYSEVGVKRWAVRSAAARRGRPNSSG